ncbi:MAG: hypothetical protein NT105_22310 [Verrucomicrobia bacterium]|nr:hypothetical protein [Verrucomicrobiota bacterium]
MKTKAISWATLAVALLALRPAGAEVPLATLEVKGSKPLALGKFSKPAIIHPNRNYVFADAPASLTGLQFTAHAHKNPAAITCTVKTGGHVYLCLWAETKFDTLGLKAADWQPAGRMNAEATGKKFPWNVFQADLREGQTLSLPACDRWGAILAAKEIKGLTKFAPVVAAKTAAPAKPLDEFAELKRQMAERSRWNTARLEKEALRPEALFFTADATPADVIWRRTNALLDHLQRLPNAPLLVAEAAELTALRKQVTAVRSAAESQQREVFDKIAKIRRRVAFKNPLLDFDSIVFLKHNKEARGDIHMVDQYLGFNAEKAGGVFALEKPFTEKPVVRSLLASSKVGNGRLKGRSLENSGGFIALDLDYDGQSILFAFTEAEWEVAAGTQEKTYWTDADMRRKRVIQSPAHYVFRPDNCYHVFKARADGSGLTQLTDGAFNDFDPCFLPSGRVAFISTRAGGQCRCGGRPVPTYTLHGMMPDGSDIIQLSWHDTNEWHPSVDNNGMLVYTRWDYVDRDSDVAHHLWRCYPDGRDPRSPHGNYPNVRESRPWMEMSIRAVPGSTKYVAVSAPHHGEAYGSLVLVDLRQREDNSTGQLRRVTPEVPLPESESAPGKAHIGRGKHTPKAEVYGTPWPLSEDFYLCVYDNGQRNYGLYLLDSFGNRELLYRDPAIACLDPIPLRARPRPPVIPVATAQAKADRGGGPAPATGTVAVMNVYESRQPWPEGVRIKDLRVVNIFPKDSAVSDAPEVGAAAQSLCRGVLGTVPVEADGSVHFKMPAGAPVYFQLLDEKGMMVQTMRSDTYVHPGEQLTCVGCHASPQASPPQPGKKTPLALRRSPSSLKPETPGSYPLSFARLVQPVLDANCVACHDREKKAPKLHGDRIAKTGRSEAFESLRGRAWGMSGGNGVALKERQYSIPGKEGARVSKLYMLLAGGHHDVKLSPADLHRITLWLDCNSNFFGAYQEADRQARGEMVPPLLGLPPWMDFATLVR